MTLIENATPARPDAGSVVARTRELIPAISERALECERVGRIPDDLFDDLQAAGVVDLLLPTSLGGLQADPLTAVEAVRALSYADASVGWTILSLNATYYVCWLDPGAARTVLAGRPRSVATVVAPRGRAVRQADGSLRVSGRWPFNSGSRNASWYSIGAMVHDGDQPATAAGGRRDWRLVFLPGDQVQVMDNWQVAGLRGTGSNDIQVSGAVVPAEFSCAPMFEPARQDAPVMRWPFFSLMGVMFAGFPIGVGERALDEFERLAPRKSRGSRPLAEETTVQLALVRARGALRAAAALVHDVFGGFWERTLAGAEPTADDQLAVRLATVHSMRAGLEAVDTAFKLAGGSALYDRSPLQRCWRDLNAAAQHGYFSEYQQLGAGRALLRLPLAEPWML